MTATTAAANGGGRLLPSAVRSYNRLRSPVDAFTPRPLQCQAKSDLR
ncbi:hypothetical protein AvCA_05520 [Azotobacter vinelandii CA]|uniref:Uncharacterized protein n=2 Tax=Azotobacter vinelandii TaxID=354 RepID=C1DKE2_AZOVD|nr:hypothetical protein Avin_05520 [Azotobacter vinelandii DJ]AGK17248.1 hypothetical protein AvCA_05520 [Azotobacter vinelandii CA]AGK19383.1 hypothetical protein AvCA6_05520 [Azotobacter vinelandii CA6]